MTKKVQIYLDEETYSFLKDRSDKERRKPGNLAGLWLIERIEKERETLSQSGENLEKTAISATNSDKIS